MRILAIFRAVASGSGRAASPGRAGVAQYAREAPHLAGDAIMTDTDAFRGAPGKQV